MDETLVHTTVAVMSAEDENMLFSLLAGVEWSVPHVRFHISLTACPIMLPHEVEAAALLVVSISTLTATSSKSPGTSKSHAAQPGLKDEAHGVDGGYSLPDAKKKDSSRTESQEPQVNVHDQPHVIPGMIPDVYVPGTSSGSFCWREYRWPS